MALETEKQDEEIEALRMRYPWFAQFMGSARKKLSAAMDLVVEDMLADKEEPSPEAMKAMRDALDFGLGE